ncbi:MAG: hypothetical protein JWR80_600 [Bradyrhizobium sp.]|nr:hypothetical protein [Bradyrhizobium sp.]
MKIAAAKIWNALLELNEFSWSAFLLCLAIAGHAYSMAVTGAKFWIDSIAYFELALALFDADQLSRLYNSGFGFLYQHVVPGMPFLIRVLDEIFGQYLWPALSVIQSLLSACAVTYFVLGFRDKLSRPAQMAVVVLCGLHPYFVSFHAAALTESVSASILLASLAIAIRALDGRLSLTFSLSLLWLLSILAAQFRPYLGLVGICVAVLVIFRRGTARRVALYAVTALAFAAGILVFPLYRAALGIGFFIPNVSALMLTHVSYVAWDLDPETAQSLNSVVLNDEIRARLVGKEAISYGDAKHIFDDLVSSGRTPAEAKQLIAGAAWRARTSSIGIVERQLQLPLASVGFQIAAVCCQPSRQLTRDMTALELFRHIRNYFRWNSGVASTNYVETFDKFSEMTRASQIYSDAAENFYAARIRPYVTDSLKSFRDPLRLTLFVTDPFILMAWLGLFLCFWPGQRTALLMMFVPFAAIYAVAVYTHIFGDNRHAHPLLPIIVVGLVKVVDDFFTRGIWARLRARWKPSHAKAGPAKLP